MRHPVPETEQQSLCRPSKKDRERELRGILCEQLLRQENQLYSDTAGVSEQNRSLGFLPAFMDTCTGATVISRFSDGSPAPVHMLDGLPEAWVTTLDADGHACKIREGVVAGFVRAGRFYTREEAANYEA